MQVLKDPDDLFRAMNRKRQEYGRIVSNSSGQGAAEAMGQAIANCEIVIMVGSIILDHNFTEYDLKRVRDYIAHAEKRLKLYEDFSDCDCEVWRARGRVDGAAWALKEIEKRMEKEP